MCAIVVETVLIAVGRKKNLISLPKSFLEVKLKKEIINYNT